MVQYVCCPFVVSLSMFQCSGVLRFAGSNPIRPRKSRGAFILYFKRGPLTIHLSILGLFEVLFPALLKIKDDHITCSSA